MAGEGVGFVGSLKGLCMGPAYRSAVTVLSTRFVYKPIGPLPDCCPALTDAPTSRSRAECAQNKPPEGASARAFQTCIDAACVLTTKSSMTKNHTPAIARSRPCHPCHLIRHEITTFERVDKPSDWQRSMCGLALRQALSSW